MAFEEGVIDEAFEQEEQGAHLLLEWMDKLDGFETLAETRFVSMSANVVVKWNNEFYPNEIGAVSYSLANGVAEDKKFHKFIDPGRLPTGSLLLASSHATRHKLPVDGWTIEASKIGVQGDIKSSKYFDEVLNSLAEFIRPTALDIDGRKYYFIFVKGNSDSNQVSQVRGSLKFLTYRSDNAFFRLLFEDRKIFVIDVSTLAKDVLNFAEKDFNEINISEICENNSFEYCPDISCEYHDRVECNFCALAVATRVWYCVSLELLKTLGLEAIAGKHTAKPEAPVKIIKSSSEYQSIGKDNWDRSSTTSRRSSNTLMSQVQQQQKNARYRPSPLATHSWGGVEPEASAASVTMSMSDTMSIDSSKASVKQMKSLERCTISDDKGDVKRSGSAGLGRGRTFQ